MPLSTVETTPLKGTADQIADRLRAAIENGTFAPGTALNQVDLAAAFGLSRIPIREALRRLEAEGYVTYRANKGATVAAPVSLDDVAEIIDVRECLEMQIMRHAVARVTDAALAEAGAALRALNRARTSVELMGAHQRFHAVFFDVARRPRTAALVNEWRFRLDHGNDPDGARRRAYARASAGIHKRLLLACERRDTSAVQRCVREEYDYMRSIAVRLSAETRVLGVGKVP